MHALGAAAYVGLIALFMNRAENIPLFGNKETLLGPMTFLLIFVISAAAMGLIVFARPLMWYLDGAKKEALLLAIYTVLFLALIAVMILGIGLTLR